MEVRHTQALQGLISYLTGHFISMHVLPPSHPVRLGLCLNLSMFYYEILNSPDRAAQISKRAYDEALADLQQQQLHGLDLEACLDLPATNTNTTTNSGTSGNVANNNNSNASASNPNTTNNSNNLSHGNASSLRENNFLPLDEHQAKDAACIMQLIKNNLSLWNSYA